MKLFNSVASMLVVLFAVGMPAGVARADDAAKQQLFIELYAVLQYDNILEQMSQNMGLQVETMLCKKFGDVDQNALKVVKEVVQEVFRDLSPEIVRFSGEFVVKNFSEADIVAMIAFYKTPTGQKSLALIPRLADKDP